MRHHTVYCDDDDLFGLPASILTDEQLNYLTASKLMGLLPTERRIESILAQRILTKRNKEDVSSLYVLEDEDWTTYALLTSAYNQLYTDTQQFNEWFSSYDRYLYVKWVALNQVNRVAEVRRLLDSKDSSVSYSNIDMTWLYAQDRDFRREVYIHALSSYAKFIPQIDAELLPELIPLMPDNPTLRLPLLYNPHTPAQYLPELLRVYAKKSDRRVKRIVCPLTTNTIMELSTVTRLQVLEHTLANTYSRDDLLRTLVDVNTVQDFSSYLFSAMTSYTNRVTDLVARFNYIYERQ